MNIINWRPRAFKQLLKLPHSVQVDIRDAALREHRYGFQMRVGSYRVLFDFDGTVKIVAVQEVKKRDERTY
jgi:mRNA interferase RelE/StbE